MEEGTPHREDERCYLPTPEEIEEACAKLRAAKDRDLKERKGLRIGGIREFTCSELGLRLTLDVT